MDTQDHVILVDENDQPIGTEEKMAAHEHGKLHRAFSIFVVNASGELLLQQRAISKYHSGGLWSNTCCSHPRPGEETLTAVHRRLPEEMGFDCPLTEGAPIVYRTALDHGLIENEFDHVFIGRWDGQPHINPVEVEAWEWKPIPDLVAEMENRPERYTFWFRALMPRVRQQLQPSS